MSLPRGLGRRLEVDTNAQIEVVGVLHNILHSPWCLGTVFGHYVFRLESKRVAMFHSLEYFKSQHASDATSYNLPPPSTRGRASLLQGSLPPAWAGPPARQIRIIRTSCQSTFPLPVLIASLRRIRTTASLRVQKWNKTFQAVARAHLASGEIGEEIVVGDAKDCRQAVVAGQRPPEVFPGGQDCQ